METPFDIAWDIIRDEILPLCEARDWERALAACRRAHGALCEAIRENTEDEGLLDDPWVLVASAAIGHGRIDVARDALAFVPLEPHVGAQLLAVLHAIESSELRSAAVLLFVLLEGWLPPIEWNRLLEALAACVSEQPARLDEQAGRSVARYLVAKGGGATPSAAQELEAREALYLWARRGLRDDDSGPMRAGAAVAALPLPARAREVAHHVWAAVDRGATFKLVCSIAHEAYLRAAREPDAERIIALRPDLLPLAAKQRAEVEAERRRQGAERSDDGASGLASGSAIRPHFLTRVGVAAAGSAFCTTVRGRLMLVTARHLLDAGGQISSMIADHEVTAPVVGVRMHDAFSGDDLGLTEGPVASAVRANGEDPRSDCLWFPVRDEYTRAIRVFELDTRAPALSEPVFVIAAERESPFFTRWRHRAKVIRRHDDLLDIEPANSSLNCADLSGAPVVGLDGRVSLVRQTPRMSRAGSATAFRTLWQPSCRHIVKVGQAERVHPSLTHRPVRFTRALPGGPASNPVPVANARSPRPRLGQAGSCTRRRMESCVQPPS